MKIQQGDVNIESAKIPKSARILKRHERGAVLALGEHTGHAHVATAEDVMLFEIDGVLYMSAPSGTEVVHEEHRAIAVPPGEYEIGIVKEFDHFAEEAKNVQD